MPLHFFLLRRKREMRRSERKKVRGRKIKELHATYICIQFKKPIERERERRKMKVSKPDREREKKRVTKGFQC